MFLTIEEIRKMVDMFMALSTFHPTRLQVTVSGENEQGEPVSFTSGYSLAGMYPEKEISGVGASSLMACTLCPEGRPVEEGHTFCARCEAQETYEDFEEYLDVWEDGDE